MVLFAGRWTIVLAQPPALVISADQQPVALLAENWPLSGLKVRAPPAYARHQCSHFYRPPALENSLKIIRKDPQEVQQQVLGPYARAVIFNGIEPAKTVAQGDGSTSSLEPCMIMRAIVASDACLCNPSELHVKIYRPQEDEKLLKLFFERACMPKLDAIADIRQSCVCCCISYKACKFLATLAYRWKHAPAGLQPQIQRLSCC